MPCPRTERSVVCSVFYVEFPATWVGAEGRRLSFVKENAAGDTDTRSSGACPGLQLGMTHTADFRVTVGLV